MRTTARSAAALSAAALLFAGACSSGSKHAGAKTTATAKGGHVLTATFTLHQEGGGFTVGAACAGSAANAAVKSGGAVEVTGVDGKAVAHGSLGDSNAATDTECVFPVKDIRLPDTATYQLTVPGQSPLTFTHDEMVQKDWHLEFGSG